MGTLFFASPWFLAGMLTLSVPFLLLLTKAKTLRVTQFSSVLFLRTITEKASNMIQWKRLLLLAVRLLMLFCLAGAFSLPFLNRRGGIFLGQVQKHLVFVLDNSYSMGYQENGKMLFDSAKEKMIETAKNQRKGKTWFSLYRFNSRLEPVVTKTTDMNQWTEKLKREELSSESTSFSELLAQMKDKITVDPEISTDVYVVSDFSVNETQIKRDLETRLRSWCPSCETHILAIQPKVYKNLILQPVTLPPYFFVPQQEGEILANFRAYGMAGEEVEISLKTDEGLVQTQKIQISDSGRGTVVFRRKFSEPGIFPMRIEAAEDALAADNTRFFLAQVHPPLKVLLIEAAEAAYPFDSPYYYFNQALESSFQENGRSWVDVVKIPLSDLSGAKLESYDLIVMADIASLDPKQATQLKYYLKAGGTVLFAPGKSFEGRKDLNGTFLSRFLGGTFGEIVQTGNPSRPLTLTAVNYRHPLLKIFEDGKRGDFSGVHFSKALRFIPEEKNGYEALFWMDSKQPVFLELKREKGRIFFWASSLNQEWSDFPKQPLYVPFLFEFIKYAAFKHQGAWQQLKAGERLIFQDKTIDFSKPIVITNPKGEEVTLYRGNQNTASIKTDSPGFYQWREYTAEGIEKKWAAVNVNLEESRPGYQVFNNESLSRENKKAAPQSSGGLASRFFVYQPLLYAVFILLLAEAWLANRFYKPSVL